MKVLLIDDHLLGRSGVQTILERYYSPVFMTNACDCRQALHIVKANSNFQLVVYNLGSADIGDCRGLRRMLDHLNNIPVVVLLASESPTVLREILALGVQGCIPTSVSNDVVACAIQMVLAGEKYAPFAALGLPDSVSSPDQSAKDHRPTAKLKSIKPGPGIKLSTRQSQVLRLVIEGKTNKEIGRTLSISETTARAHITAIFKALAVTNRTQACYVAAQLGLWQETGIRLARPGRTSITH